MGRVRVKIKGMRYDWKSGQTVGKIVRHTRARARVLLYISKEQDLTCRPVMLNEASHKRENFTNN